MGIAELIFSGMEGIWGEDISKAQLGVSRMWKALSMVLDRRTGEIRPTIFLVGGCNEWGFAGCQTGGSGKGSKRKSSEESKKAKIEASEKAGKNRRRQV